MSLSFLRTPSTLYYFVQNVNSLLFFPHISFTKFLFLPPVPVYLLGKFIHGKRALHTQINLPHAQASFSTQSTRVAFGCAGVKQTFGAVLPLVQVRARCWEMREQSEKSHWKWEKKKAYEKWHIIILYSNVLLFSNLYVPIPAYSTICQSLSLHRCALSLVSLDDLFVWQLGGLPPCHTCQSLSKTSFCPAGTHTDPKKTDR